MLKEILDEGLDLSFQQVFRSTGDDEIIRITNEVHGGTQTCKRLETPSCWVVFLQELLKPIQRTVSERWGDQPVAKQLVHASFRAGMEEARAREASFRTHR